MRSLGCAWLALGGLWHPLAAGWKHCSCYLPETLFPVGDKTYLRRESWFLLIEKTAETPPLRFFTMHRVLITRWNGQLDQD